MTYPPMAKPTNRQLLADAERIMRELLSEDRSVWEGAWDDMRDWLIARNEQTKGRKRDWLRSRALLTKTSKAGKE